MLDAYTKKIGLIFTYLWFKVVLLPVKCISSTTAWFWMMNKVNFSLWTMGSRNLHGMTIIGVQFGLCFQVIFMMCLNPLVRYCALHFITPIFFLKFSSSHSASLLHAQSKVVSKHEKQKMSNSEHTYTQCSFVWDKIVWGSVLWTKFWFSGTLYKSCNLCVLCCLRLTLKSAN